MKNHCINYPLLAAATVNAKCLQKGRSYFHGFALGSLNDAPIHIFLYDMSEAPEAGSTPIARFMIPANATAANGSGSNLFLCPPMGSYIDASGQIKDIENGLAVRITKDIASTGTTAVDASEVPVNIFFS